ncbi:MAG: hypothetical protein GXO88_10985 [Chlorobi bacterium]|nr:hypothetical protein [Chlorobiota bacterium]
MKFTTFKTPKPKRFSYRPRYYDKAKEERERRKAEMGYESSLGHNDSLRSRISVRWGKDDEKETKSKTAIFYYLIYAALIIGSIYFIFFTDFVDNLVALFGIRK